MSKIFLSLFTLLLFQIKDILTQSIDATLKITLSNSIVQQQSEYTFNLVFIYNDPLVLGSTIQIYFPSQYVSNSSTAYPCELKIWPFTVPPSSIKCNITNRILSLSGAFPQQYAIDQETIFQFSVKNIVNPYHAGTTSQFSGFVLAPDSTQIVGIAQQTINIATGVLSVLMSVSPAVVSTSADLNVNITTTHPLPPFARLRLYLSSNTWERASSISPQNIFLSSPSCNTIYNTPSNLYCDTLTSANQRTITIFNINNLGGFASSGPVSFSFKISSIQSPPTTEPQGSFSFTILDSNSKSIDASQNNKVGNLGPKQIMAPSLSLTNYICGQYSNATIKMSINTLIQSSDTINIKFPLPVDISQINRVVAENTQIPLYSIVQNVLSFTGLQIVTSIPVTIVINGIKNPAYVIDVSRLGSTFSLWTSRNGYKINEKVNPFTYQTLPGDINSTITSMSSTQAGQLSVYSMSITFQHSISKDNFLQIVFSSDFFNIKFNSIIKPYCSSNLSPNCNLTLLADNFCRLTNVISTSNINRYSSILITIYNVTNPLKIGTFFSVQITSYNIDGFVVDKQDNITGFLITARKFKLSQISMSTSASQVYGLTKLTLDIQTNNPITTSSYLLLYIPLQLGVGSLSCDPFCLLINTTTHYIYRFDISSFYNMSNPAFIKLILTNLRNQKTTKPTNSFQIYIYNSVTIDLLQYLNNGLEYKLCVTPTFLSIQLTRNSTTNSQKNVKYEFRFGLNFDLSDSTLIKLIIPNSIPCKSCIKSFANGSSYETIITTSASGSPIIIQSLQSSYISIYLTNHYSDEKMTIKVILLTNDNTYKIAENSVQTTNQYPSIMNVSYSFNPLMSQQLSSKSTLSFSSISVSYAQFSYLNIQFGGQFEASNIELSVGSNQYSLNIISSTLIQLKKTLNSTNSTNAKIFQIANISTPSFTPSTGILIETFTEGNHKIDKVQNLIKWQTSCKVPCRQCSANSQTTCQSCYNDRLLANSKILYFSNGTLSTCLSQCPPLYYLQNITNKCQKCSTNCLECINYDICTSCPQNLPYLFQKNQTSACFFICPPGYYYSNETLPFRCLQCSLDRKCQTCTNFLTCNSCKPNFYLYLSQCISSCPNLTTIGNQYLWKCQQCPVNCSTCQRDYTVPGSFIIKCLSCSNGFLFDNGGCYSTCISYGLVPNSLTRTCTVCDSSCQTCSKTLTNCTSCYKNSTKKYFLNNSCISTCDNGYYSNEQLFLCLPCTKPCQFCNSSSVSSCISCISGYFLFGSICKNDCPEGYYKNGSLCNPCPNQCVSCSSLLVCLSCKQNYSLFANRQCRVSCLDGYVSINRICTQCSSNCKTCSLVNYCSSCFVSMFLYEGLCVNPCPPKFYKNNQNFTCESCPFQCKQCSSKMVCLSCISGYQLITYIQNVNVTCNSSCISGYVPIDGICQKCTVGCTQCTYTQSNCTTCTSNYYFYSTSTSISTINSCYLSCPLTLFSDRIAFKCYLTCPFATYSIIQYSSNDSSLIISKSCISCPNLCFSCESNFTCLSCVTGASMYNNLCYSRCPPIAQYSLKNICKTCNILQCYQCSSTTCIQCNSPFLLILTETNNACITSCGNLMFYNITAKQCQIDANRSTTENSNTTNSTTNTALTTQIKFIPLPFSILGVVLIIVAYILHSTQGIQIFGCNFGIFGALLQISSLTTVGVLGQFIMKQINNSLQNSVYNSNMRMLTQIIVFGQKIYHKVFIMLIAGCSLMIIMNIIIFVIYCCKVRISPYRIVAVFSVFLSFKLIGALLCSNFYQINMKKKPKQTSLQKEINQNQINKVQPYKDSQEKILKSHYAKSMTNRSSSFQKMTKFQQLQALKISKIKKVNDNSHQSIIQIEEELKQKKQLNEENSEENNQNIVENTSLLVKDQNQNSKRGYEEKTFMPEKQKMESSKGISNQENQVSSNIYKNKDISFRNKNTSMKDVQGNISKKNRLTDKTNKNINQSQQIDEFSQKPSRFHSMMNPDISFPQNQYIQLKIEENSTEKKTGQTTALNQRHNPMQIFEQYHQFWLIYDKIILVNILIDLLLVGSGGILCFNFTYVYFQFFAGIELIVLGVLDLVMIGLWRIWNYQKDDNSSKRQKTRNSLKYEQQSNMSLKQMSRQKVGIGLNDQSLNNINEEIQSQNDRKNKQINRTGIMVQDEVVMQQSKKTKTEMNNTNIDQQQKKSSDKDYKSQYARPIDVLVLNNEQIEEAIQKGVYRHNKKQLADKQFVEDEESKIENAQKFNRIMQQQNQNKLNQNGENFTSEKRNSSAIKQELLMQDDDNNSDNEAEDKQINQIIFEDEQESLQETQFDGIDDNEKRSQDKKQMKKRKDSLGSEKGQQNKKYQEDFFPKTIEGLKQSVQKKSPLEKQESRNIKRTPIQIQNFDQGDFSPKLKVNEKSFGQSKIDKIDRQTSKNFTNIFDNQFIEEDNETQRRYNQKSEELQIIDLKNVYRNKIQQALNKKNQLQRLSVAQTKRANSRVIYADLQSVGTVSQYDLDEEEDRAKHQTIQPRPNIRYKASQQPNELIARPSEFIQTNFVYHNNRKSIDQNLPQKLSVSRPKKISKKQTNLK